MNNPTKVVIATHGYLERANPGTWIYNLKNGWLERDASHVVIVDWKKGNRVNYFQAASNVRVIGMMIGQLILRNNIADKTLAVGFSLGAQIIGEAGKFVKSGGVTSSDSEIPANETLSDNGTGINNNSNLGSVDGETWNSESDRRDSRRTSSSRTPNETSRRGGGSSNADAPNRDSLLNPRPQVKNERQGKQIIKECHGLDPAGPFFDGCPNDLVLDKSDCGLVQVIHTSASADWKRVIGILEADFGSWKKAGHCDYWINCGRGPQPNCVVKKFGDFLRGALGAESNETVRESSVSCSHGRAPEIYNAQLNNTCNFKALDCPNCVEDTNCTGFADSMFRDQSTDYFGFMMDSNCSSNDDKNFFVRTSGGSTLCDYSNDRRPNQNTNRGNNQNNRDQSENRQSTRRYTSTTRVPNRRQDEEDESRQPVERNRRPEGNGDRNSNDDPNRDGTRRNSSDGRGNSDRNSDDRESNLNNGSNTNSNADRDSNVRNLNDRSEEFRQPAEDRFQQPTTDGTGRRTDTRQPTVDDSTSEGRSGFFPMIHLW